MGASLLSGAGAIAGWDALHGFNIVTGVSAPGAVQMTAYGRLPVVAKRPVLQVMYWLALRCLVFTVMCSVSSTILTAGQISTGWPRRPKGSALAFGSTENHHATL
jgi:hypothetical protein